MNIVHYNNFGPFNFSITNYREHYFCNPNSARFLDFKLKKKKTFHKFVDLSIVVG